MNFIEFVRRCAANYVSVKIALSILGLAISIPLISVLYWSFDSAYLAAFGVGPEIYSRPVFSSKLMLTWFILGSITPAIWLIGIVAVTLSVVLFGINYRASRSLANAVQVEPAQAAPNEVQPVRMIDIIDRSITPSIYLFLTPLLVLLFLLFGMMLMSNKAEKLASDQVDAYVKKGNCPDTFNNKTNGCYSISDEPDNNYFIIANDEKLVIYLSRKEAEKEIFVYVTVKDKLSNKKVTRGFRKVQRSDIEPKKEEKS